MSLIPADPNQCQCEITPAHGFMRLGPKPKPERCPNKPTYYAVEIVAGKDGQYGAMSLCRDCAREMAKDHDLCERVRLVPIMQTLEELFEEYERELEAARDV